ncbi:MAG: alpha/beta fold hydrolase [Chloroflexota bacterium]
MPTVPAWERRFRSPILSFPAWAADDPDRLVIASTESGSYQLHAWDRRTGERRQVTHDKVGILSGMPTRDGTGVIWFHDATGAESGAFVVAPFDEDVAAEPLVEGVPEGWSEGIAVGLRRTAIAISTDDDYSVWVADDGAPARLLHRHQQPVRLAGGWGMSGAMGRSALSSDDALLVLEVMEDGDVLHPSLRSVDAATGAELAGLSDPGLELAAFGFSPVAGDDRVAITTERSGDRRPALWNARTGALVELEMTMAGTVEPVGWWPDASALLLLVLEAGRHQLYRYDLGAGAATLLATEPGSITAAAVRPDGAVWYRGHCGEHPARILEVGSDVAVAVIEGPDAPAGRPMETWWFKNPHGQDVHGFIVRPDGDGPHPVIMRVHGGPHSTDMDRWAPDIAAHADAGFLVAMVNYRGSEGFGQAWRDALTGNIGFLELEDVLAGLDDLVGRGLADAAQVVLAGWSWGGYVGLLGAGRHPERWRSVVAGVPVADYVAAYEDESPSLQALDRALFGGTPETVPALYVERNPITYVDAVTAPLLIMAGVNDSRCPIRQVWNYVERLRARDVAPRVYTYATGHASFDIDERVRQTAIVLDFLAATVPGATRLEGLDAHLPES